MNGRTLSGNSRKGSLGPSTKERDVRLRGKTSALGPNGLGLAVMRFPGLGEADREGYADKFGVDILERCGKVVRPVIARGAERRQADHIDALIIRVRR
jgi:hypothetical protein